MVGRGIVFLQTSSTGVPVLGYRLRGEIRGAQIWFCSDYVYT